MQLTRLDAVLKRAFALADPDIQETPRERLLWQLEQKLAWTTQRDAFTFTAVERALLIELLCAARRREKH